MDEDNRRSSRRGKYGRKWPERPKSEFPAMPYPENARVTVKHIAYLHAYCGNEPREIAARYPRTVSLAQVHLALAHYYSNREPVDAEIAEELKFARTKSLDHESMAVPAMRDAWLTERDSRR